MYKALEEAKKEGNDYKYYLESKPRCPHCGEEFDVNDNEAWHLYGDDGAENLVECDYCEKEFTVTTNVSYSFSTDEQPEDDPEDEL